MPIRLVVELRHDIVNMGACSVPHAHQFVAVFHHGRLIRRAGGLETRAVPAGHGERVFGCMPVSMYQVHDKCRSCEYECVLAMLPGLGSQPRGYSASRRSEQSGGLAVEVIALHAVVLPRK